MDTKKEKISKYAKKKINNQTNELYPAPYKILNILDKTYANKRDLKLEKRGGVYSGAGL